MLPLDAIWMALVALWLTGNLLLAIGEVILEWYDSKQKQVR